ncbi:hypothetical protein ACWCYZ_31865 [Streptomyces virginiae]
MLAKASFDFHWERLMARDVEIINEKGESEFVDRDFARDLVANGYGAWPNSREGRRRTGGGSGGAGQIAKAVVSGAITFAGAYGQPQQSSNTTVNNWDKSSQETQSDHRTRDLDEGTRDKGRRTGGSGQQG